MIWVALIIIILIFLIVSGRRRKKIDRLRKRIDGNGPTRTARDLVSMSRPRTMLQHYELATLYDFHFGDVKMANTHYTKALSSVNGDTAFIRTKVQDRLQMGSAETDDFYQDLGNDPDLQMALVLSLKLSKQTPSNPVWHLDPQNVHDSTLSNEVAAQYKKLKALNFETPLTEINDIMIAIQNMPVTDEQDKAEYHAAVQMLARIRDQNIQMIKLDQEPEPEFIKNVWVRASQNGTGRRGFVTALSNSWQNGEPVCSTGRISNVLSSLSYMDDAAGLGTLKTKEALRNEIFSKAGDIVQRLHVDGLDDETSPEYKTWRIAVEQKINAMVDEYNTNMSASDLQQARTDALAGIL